MVGRACGRVPPLAPPAILTSLWFLHILPAPKKARWDAAVPLCPPALVQDLMVLDGSSYSVAAALGVILDYLQVRRCQNISRVQVDALPSAFPVTHACEATSGLNMESLYVAPSLSRKGGLSSRCHALA